MKRVGVIGIVIQDRTQETVLQVQTILSEYGHIILGRMGIPVPENNIAAISLIVRGENELISALNGKLGRLPNVSVKSALNTVSLE